jgi:hypothetical protein
MVAVATGPDHLKLALAPRTDHRTTASANRLVTGGGVGIHLRADEVAIVYLEQPEVLDRHGCLRRLTTRGAPDRCDEMAVCVQDAIEVGAERRRRRRRSK